MTTETPLGIPVHNLNGTGIEDLLRQHWAVMEATRALKKALAEAAPHGRDYQTFPDYASGLGPARAQWLKRMEEAAATNDWAEARLTDLMRQGNERYGDKFAAMASNVLRHKEA